MAIQIKPDHKDLQMAFKILLKWKMNLCAHDCKVMDMGKKLPSLHEHIEKLKISNYYSGKIPLSSRR